MEIKVGCGCGQNYKFDVDPVNGRMPVKVACPGCGTDGTESANHFLTQQFPNSPPPVPVALRVESAGPLRVSLPAAAPAVAAPPPISSIPGPITSRPSPAVKAGASKPKKSEEFSLVMGIVGAVLGAAVGAGLMYGFFAWAHFRFPMMGTCIGALAGWGARTLAKGTESTLGAIAAFIALVSTFAALYLMYGGVAGLFILSLAVSAYFAYRIAG